MRLALHFVTVADAPTTLWTLRRGTSARVPGDLHPHARSGAGAGERHDDLYLPPSPKATRCSLAEKWRQEYLAEEWVEELAGDPVRQSSGTATQ